MHPLESRVAALEDSHLAIVQWRRTIDESIIVQREMIEVGRDIAAAIKILGWVGKAIKWLAALSASCGIVYATLKGVYHK